MTSVQRMLDEIERLKPTPKKSTTSRSICGDGGITPVRTATVKERRELATTPDNPVQARWDAHEAAWAERERRWEEEKQRKQDEIKARNQARADEIRRNHQRERARRNYEISEQFIDGVFEENALTKDEQAVVRQRMCDMGAPQDAALASVLARELVLTRKK